MGGGRAGQRLPHAFCSLRCRLDLVRQVDVSFSLSLELLSYQKLPADQMLPGVDIRQSESGEKEMVFTQNLLLEYANQTTQVSPRPVLVGSEEDKPDSALRNKRSPGPY